MIVQGPDGKRISFPDGTPPEQIKAAMAKHYGGPSASAPTMMTAQNNPVTSRLSGLQARALGLLPTAGGIVGGIAGGAIGSLAGGAGTIPGAIIGAGAGGAYGEGLREFGGREPLSASRIGISGAEQAGYQAIGGALAKGAGAVARPLMRRALGIGEAIGGRVKVGSKLFPDPVETALERGLPVTAKGAVKAGMLRMESGAALKELLKKEAASGRKFSTMAVARHVDALLRSKVLPTEAKEKILKDVTAFYSEKGRTISPTLLQKVKQYYQRQARAIYRAGEEGAFTLADQPHGQFAEALARGAREQLETVPGVAARNVETQRLMGAEKAISRAAQRPPRAFDVIRPGTYPAVGILGSPKVLSKVALTLNAPWFKTLSRQSPRAAAALIQQLTYSDEPDVTSTLP